MTMIGMPFSIACTAEVMLEKPASSEPPAIGCNDRHRRRCTIVTVASMPYFLKMPAPCANSGSALPSAEPSTAMRIGVSVLCASALAGSSADEHGDDDAAHHFSGLPPGSLAATQVFFAGSQRQITIASRPMPRWLPSVKS